MPGMKKTALLTILALLSITTAGAAEPEMRAALAKWEQQMTEYHAALQVASTDEQRAAVRVPDGRDMAAELWRSVNRKVGEREELVRPTAQERMNGAVDERKMVSIYEFEQPWAAPAVVWFLNHPDAFAQVFGNRQRQISFFANALLESVNRVHFSSPYIANACAKLSESQSVRVYELLQKIYSLNQDLTARASAAMAMCIMLTNPTIQGAEGSAAMARNKQLYFLRQAARISPEDTMFGTRSMNDAILEMTYVLRNLSVGSIPPQLTVKGMDGNETTFPVQGRANLIFFWSPSEQVGLNVVTKQHLLAQQFPGLVFCPVTVHANHSEWLMELRQLGIVGNCFMDNEQNSNGKAYRISQLPTAVLVGPDSRILFIGYPNLGLQTALDNLYASQRERGARVVVEGTPGGEEAPTIQPGSQPTGPSGSQSAPPALRDMPNDL